MKITTANVPQLDPDKVISVLNAGATFVDKTAPLFKLLFDKINAAIMAARSNNPDSYKNVRVRLAALEAKDVIAKEKAKIQDELNLQLIARIEKLEQA